jgi:TnpA family transposase
MATESHRLSILSDQEIEDLYGLPKFTDDDRLLYFDLSPAEKAAAGAIKTASVAAFLMVELGYFKAKRQFFSFEAQEVRDDLRFVVELYFPDRKLEDFKLPSRPTRGMLQKTVLDLFQYRDCGPAERTELEAKAQRVAMLSTQPVYILREMLQQLTIGRIVAPSYTSLQDIVGRVVSGERTRIIGLLAEALTPEVGQRLRSLLEADEQLYDISALKREAKDFTYGELRREVARRDFFEPLHDFAVSFLASAGLSHESSKYYGSLVKFYTVYKLQRMQASSAQLYLLCFAYQRFRQINDNLTDAFIHLVDQYEKQAKSQAEVAMQKALDDALESLKAAGQVLELFVDDSILPEVPFADVRRKAFALLEREQFPIVSDYMKKIAFDKAAFEWAYYGTLSKAFKQNLRHLFAGLEFAGRVENAPLVNAVEFLQDLFKRDKSPRQTDPAAFPIDVIPKHLQRYLYVPLESDRRKKVLDPDKFEFLVYRMLRNALEAGDVFVQKSTEFRRFEDDLISDDRWRNRDAVLREVNLPILNAPIEDTLAAFHESIEGLLESVNQRIDHGENKHIKFKGNREKRKWNLLYPAIEESVNSPFYSQLPGIGVADLLWFVASETDFLSGFTHVLDRYVKHDPDPREILACIVAMGTNMGLWRMAEVSGMSHASLLSTSRNFLRPETLRAANDAITNAIAKLPAFHLYDIREEMHSSSDGQRIETQINTFNARYAPKYFGLQKGVSSITLVANHVPVNAKIIGTHEHESHYVFDLLYNNTSDIRPERHSTDTHGTNQVNFIILRSFEYEFAPRYKNFPKKVESIIGFQHPNQYGDALIKPCRKVYDDLIIQEWPNIQRILVSLAQKDVTQSTIVRKLASYTRQNSTKRALWELDNLCFTEYVLKYIDDPGLRQGVQKALNRGEAYHRFRRAVAYVNGGKFRVRTEEEQHIWNECSRLIANAVIYYNTLLLSRVYEQKLAASDEAAIELMRRISPIAWQHINLFGTFEFSPDATKLDIDALVAMYSDPTYWLNTVKEHTEVPPKKGKSSPKK